MNKVYYLNFFTTTMEKISASDKMRIQTLHEHGLHGFLITIYDMEKSFQNFLFIYLLSN